MSETRKIINSLIEFSDKVILPVFEKVALIALSPIYIFFAAVICLGPLDLLFFVLFRSDIIIKWLTSAF